MKLIAHRGNLTGPNPLRENSIDYIEDAISEGFDVEIDLRVEGNECYLGHDDPQYFVTMEWLRKYKDVLWIHCKNCEALEKMSSSVVEFNYFWHETDCYTITSKNIGWVYPGKQPYSNSIVVVPESNPIIDFNVLKMYNCFGICSDYVGKII
jgi:hypothetical protein